MPKADISVSGQCVYVGPEFRTLKNKARTWAVETTGDIRASFLIPVKGNGAKFINWRLESQ
jgi:hypothetical protein